MPLNARLVKGEADSRITSTSVARIALVSPDRAKQIEAILLRMVQSGQLRGRVSEEQLIGLLDQVCFDLYFYYGQRLKQ